MFEIMANVCCCIVYGESKLKTTTNLILWANEGLNLKLKTLKAFKIGKEGFNRVGPLGIEPSTHRL